MTTGAMLVILIVIAAAGYFVTLPFTPKKKKRGK
jgi:hypothetical protein